VVMLEKAVIALIGMILTGFVSLQLAMLGVLFTVTIVVSKGRYPYVRNEDNRLQEVLRWCSLVVLSAGHTLHTDDFPNDTVRSILTDFKISQFFFFFFFFCVVCFTHRF
jgi:hypothetical protein